MSSGIQSVVKFVKTTPNRSFFLYPLATLLWEFFVRGGKLVVEPYFLVLMIWGYGQYRLCGKYRRRIGGGGPGLEKPPERLATSGPYRYIRNPMYLGHIIFLTGLTLTLRSALAALITIGTAIWFHYRILGDERRLVELFGEPYLDYTKKVKRWIPGVL
ncbi:MAG: isoprenylcysteine carboxylmethyltransferase family protein [Candidatus Tectomicrobia bacterium]|uniref:Isoprenylcysteine carboxylmethyltransferase family protein n=1 Tax=Tectimicrobiota bacterium TaxID=2528274 RepID=A0A932M028_UNCTE|nr:isoprenylcysteine carboxylmethyltransferase family protein [Candidatus Tectomicrobia bacterium]